MCMCIFKLHALLLTGLKPPATISVLSVFIKVAFIVFMLQSLCHWFVHVFYHIDTKNNIRVVTVVDKCHFLSLYKCK